MRLVSFEGGFGRIEGDEVISMGEDIVDYLRHGRRLDHGSRKLDAIHLAAPIPNPGKIVGVGLNYRDHARESGQTVPSEPVLFAKFANSVIGPGAPICIPPDVPEVDYEAELGVVIGKTATQVRREAALEYVAGYTCLNDVSSRSYQFSTGQWLRGKAIDTFLPMGPHLVTTDEVADPHSLPIRCIVSGELLQSSNTAEMVFGVNDLVAFISQTITLEPGDVIATGTPAGVGFARTPPRFLNEGDVVTVSIPGIGDLTNPVTAEGRARVSARGATSITRPEPSREADHHD